MSIASSSDCQSLAAKLSLLSSSIKDFGRAAELWQVIDGVCGGSLKPVKGPCQYSHAKHPLCVSLQRAAEESRKYFQATLMVSQTSASDQTTLSDGDGGTLHNYNDDDSNLESGRGDGSPNMGEDGEVATSRGSTKHRRVTVLRSLQGAAAQLQALGYEAGVWDLMGAVVISRRALEALTIAVTSV